MAKTTISLFRRTNGTKQVPFDPIEKMQADQQKILAWMKAISVGSILTILMGIYATGVWVGKIQEKTDSIKVTVEQMKTLGDERYDENRQWREKQTDVSARLAASIESLTKSIDRLDRRD